MLDAPPIVLCSKLCRHNVLTPSSPLRTLESPGFLKSLLITLTLLLGN